MERPFTHVDATGRLRMVDVSTKRPSRRRAEAHCVVVTSVDVTKLAPRADGLSVLHVARVAGVLAAKRTPEIIPLCHSLNLNDVDVVLEARNGGLTVTSSVTATQRTGVEMEALTACAFAALSVLDALTEADPEARVEDLVLLRKEGGKSGNWGRLVAGATVRAPKRTLKLRRVLIPRPATATRARHES